MADWQVDPAALRKLAAMATGARTLGGFAYVGGGPGGLGFLGAGSTAEAAAAVTAEAAAAATGIGAPVAAIIALASDLFSKDYFNVAQADAACQKEESLWSQYVAIQGHVSGRSLGWATMQELMHAATGEGLFPGNNTHLSFHEGTLQCAGNGAWVDQWLCNGKVQYDNCKNCICDVLPLYSAQLSTKPAATPDAVWFIDSLFVPLFTSTASIPWITDGIAASAEVHQLMYDVADAYLAANVSGSVAYVAVPATPAASVSTSTTAPVAATTTTPVASAPAVSATSAAASTGSTSSATTTPTKEAVTTVTEAAPTESGVTSFTGAGSTAPATEVTAAPASGMTATDWLILAAIGGATIMGIAALGSRKHG